MGEFNFNKVKDPMYFKENRIAAHSDHRYYSCLEKAYAKEEEFRFSLNGLWKFHYAINKQSALNGFEAEDYDCKGWEDIHVPSHIQMEGYDVPQYVNVQYPWNGREEVKLGEIPTRFNPVASYVKYFTLADEMQNKPMYVSFQGVESAFALWLNGHFVGYSEDTFTPSEFELTPYIKAGENKLAVQVFRWSSSSWCEDQDFFRFSGIFREVYLYTIPSIHLKDLKVQTLLNDDFSRAELVVDTLSTASGKVKMSLKDREGGLVGQLDEALVKEGHYCLEVNKPELWSAEQPYLYTLEIELMNEQNEVVEAILQRIGFRKFELKDQVMQLNGKRIVFKGVNRHEFSSKTGRCITEEEIRQDLRTMKQHNINAIRTSHYPNGSKLYELCDEYGIYMIDETNLEAHGLWDCVWRGIFKIEEAVPGNRPEWLPMLLDRANSMYQRDKNHPAILIWSCGNESYGGKDIYEMSQFFRKEDPTRLVHYEGVNHDRRYNETTDIESQMYTKVEDIKAYLKEHRERPMICCEYSHAMGNSCGALYKYTRLTEEESLYQGGFIWDYIDQSITKKDRYGNEFEAYGGDFDERPCDGNFSGNGIVYGGDRTPSPKMQEVKYQYQNIEVLFSDQEMTIINKNLFTNTNAFSCEARLQKDGKLINKKSFLIDCEPMSQKKCPLPFEKATMPGEYAITVSFVLKEETIWAERGHEVAFGQDIYQVEGEKEEKNALLKTKMDEDFEIVHGVGNIGVRGSHFQVIFSERGLISYRYAGKEMLKTMPMPNFWRAPIDNDNGNGMQRRYGQWKLASLYLYPKERTTEAPNPVIEEKADSLKVIYSYIMPTTPESSCTLGYEVFRDGEVSVKLSYDPVKELGDMPEFGVMFKLDADYSQLEWYGLGPEETYSDRQMGAKLGIYQNQVKDNLAKYLVPQECGNKTGVRYAKVMDQRGRGVIFSGDALHFSALPYTPHELENALHPYELPPIHYTVVRVCKQQMGIGGDDSWGARVHDEFLIDVSKQVAFEFSFKGLDG